MLNKSNDNNKHWGKKEKMDREKKEGRPEERNRGHHTIGKRELEMEEELFHSFQSVRTG